MSHETYSFGQYTGIVEDYNQQLTFDFKEKRKINKKMDVDKVVYLTKDFIDKTPEGEVLDLLGLNKYCCRRHMLTHVDIE